MKLNPSIVGELEKVSPSISKAKLAICYVGMTEDRRFFSEEFVQKLIPSLAYAPVVSNYSDITQDYSGHRDDANVYGLVPSAAEADIKFEVLDDKKTWLTASVYFWTERFPFLEKIKGFNHSLELSEDGLETEWSNDQGDQPYLKYIDGRFVGLSILGKNQQPGFEGSRFFSTLPEISLDTYAKIKKFINSVGEMTMWDKVASGLKLLYDKVGEENYIVLNTYLEQNGLPGLGLVLGKKDDKFVVVCLDGSIAEIELDSLGNILEIEKEDMEPINPEGTLPSTGGQVPQSNPVQSPVVPGAMPQAEPATPVPPVPAAPVSQVGTPAPVVETPAPAPVAPTQPTSAPAMDEEDPLVGGDEKKMNTQTCKVCGSANIVEDGQGGKKCADCGAPFTPEQEKEKAPVTQAEEVKPDEAMPAEGAPVEDAPVEDAPVEGDSEEPTVEDKEEEMAELPGEEVPQEATPVDPGMPMPTPEIDEMSALRSENEQLKARIKEIDNAEALDFLNKCKTQLSDMDFAELSGQIPTMDLPAFKQVVKMKIADKIIADAEAPQLPVQGFGMEQFMRFSRLEKDNELHSLAVQIAAKKI